jgi:hypothetical protein
MPGEMAAHEDIGDLADARIRRTFTTPPDEPLEEITDIEEIREGGEPLPAVAPPIPVKGKIPAPVEELPQDTVGEVDLEPTSLRVPEAAPPAWFEELAEIEVELPEKGPVPPAPPPPDPSLFTMSTDVEGSGLTFLKFEAPFVSPEGQAVLPVVFIDAVGNPVRLRIRVTMDGE